MGNFDKEIARSREHLALAKQDLKDVEEGFTYFINDQDMKDEIKSRAERNIDLHTRLIANYEEKNA